MTEEKKLKFHEWIYRLKYALVAIGSCKGGNYGVLHIKLAEDAWKPLYDDGFSPIQAAIESELNS